jgi:hypothetical protein
MDLREIGLGGVEWIRLAPYRYRWRAILYTLFALIFRRCKPTDGKVNHTALP